MSASIATLANGIERAASGAAMLLDRLSATRWSGAMSNGAPHRLEMQLDQDWLLVREEPGANPAPVSAETLQDALRQNTTAPTEIKLALSPAKHLTLRSEQWLADEADAEQRARGVLEAFRKVWDGSLPAVTGVPEDWAADVERRCEESGWHCVRRSTGRLTVALETNLPLQAIVVPFGGGARISAEVADFSAAPAVSRTAAAVLALETSGRIRMVRAATDESGTQIRFETVFATLPTADQLTAAFCALSSAVTLTAEALGALPDENLARDYLAVRGWPADIQNPKPETKKDNI
jgi:hypothetical protein